jgi:hypothetical protein
VEKRPYFTKAKKVTRGGLETRAARPKPETLYLFSFIGDMCFHSVEAGVDYKRFNWR